MKETFCVDCEHYLEDEYEPEWYCNGYGCDPRKLIDKKHDFNNCPKYVRRNERCNIIINVRSVEQDPIV